MFQFAFEKPIFESRFKLQFIIQRGFFKLLNTISLNLLFFLLVQNLSERARSFEKTGIFIYIFTICI